MSILRAAVTFLIVLGVVLLAIFQMQLRGYQKVARLNEYVLYETDVEECNELVLNIQDTTYTIDCENAYLITSGFAEYTLEEALEQELITILDLESYVTID